MKKRDKKKKIGIKSKRKKKVRRTEIRKKIYLFIALSIF